MFKQYKLFFLISFFNDDQKYKDSLNLLYSSKYDLSVI